MKAAFHSYTHIFLQLYKCGVDSDYHHHHHTIFQVASKNGYLFLCSLQNQKRHWQHPIRITMRELNVGKEMGAYKNIKLRILLVCWEYDVGSMNSLQSENMMSRCACRVTHHHPIFFSFHIALSYYRPSSSS